MPFAGDDTEPFNGGYLLPVPALWIRPALIWSKATLSVDGGPLVACLPGFGTFEDLILDSCLTDPC